MVLVRILDLGGAPKAMAPKLFFIVSAVYKYHSSIHFFHFTKLSTLNLNYRNIFIVFTFSGLSMNLLIVAISVEPELYLM